MSYLIFKRGKGGRDMLSNIIMILIALAIANFLFETVTKRKKWSEAIERTIFQAIAIIIFAITAFH